MTELRSEFRYVRVDQTPFFLSFLSFHFHFVARTMV